jgi:hypothetical protein
VAGFSSNSKIFARRGNPWVSRREGERDFGRNLETEDAEFDFDNRFHSTPGTFGKPLIPKPRQEYHDPKPEPATEDFARKKAGIIRKMRSGISSSQPRLIKAETLPRTFKLCPGCRHARCAATMQCHGPEIMRARRRGEVNG